MPALDHPGGARRLAPLALIAASAAILSACSAPPPPPAPSGELYLAKPAKPRPQPATDNDPNGGAN